VVLGNHDLHLLAVAAGIRPVHRDDTVDEILAAPDRDALLHWMRGVPLAHREQGVLFVHAGVLPDWDADRTLALSEEVRLRLAADDHAAFLREMYGNEPARWDDALTGHDRLRCVVNALTRVRMLAPDGTMNLKHKDASARAPAGLVPWFDHPQRATRGTPIVFGHWSTEGLVMREDAIGLDTGCVWGGRLTALRLEDRALFQVDCPLSQAPGD
jgi:bis(5'-nucleosyl)-tetraphosphatase (symmetrical)